jgi:hypothetical protein
MLCQSTLMERKKKKLGWGNGEVALQYSLKKDLKQPYRSL